MGDARDNQHNQRLPLNPIQSDDNGKFIIITNIITGYNSKITLFGKPRAFSPLGAWAKAAFFQAF